MFVQRCTAGEHNSVLDHPASCCRRSSIHSRVALREDGEVESNIIPLLLSPYAYRGIEYSICFGNEVLPWFRVFIPA